MVFNRRKNQDNDIDNASDTGSNDNDANKKDKKPKSRKPPNTAFRQQRLLAYAPILTPKTVLPLFFAVGIIFGPIGGLLLYASSKVQEITIDYTHCAQDANSTDFSTIPSDLISTAFSGSNSTSATEPQWKTIKTQSPFGFTQDVCQIRFTVPTDFTPPVMLYYRLTNFYQNHRRYVKSVDEQQLQGQNKSAAQLESDGGCTPLITAPNGKPYYPCGLIANSLFNDTFHLPVLLNVGGSSQTNQTYNMTNQNIAWSSDSARFGKTTYTNDQVMPPPNWVLRYPNGTYDDAHPLPDLSTWYEFQVWMRTAGLPTFSKLALRNADEVMTAGTYQIDIDMSITSDSVGWELTVDFPVTEYGGTKTLVLSTRTVIGGQNNFLGIAYIVVAGLCILLGAIFTARHLIKPRKLGDHQYLSWNTAPTASGREMNIGGVLTGR